MKRKTLPQITPPDPAQIRMAGVAPVSMGEQLGWLAAYRALKQLEKARTIP
jgi:hypothetical protein